MTRVPSEDIPSVPRFVEEGGRLLASPGGMRLLIALLDRPLPARGIARLLGCSVHEAEATAQRWVEAGLPEPWRRTGDGGDAQVAYRPIAARGSTQQLPSEVQRATTLATLAVAEGVLREAQAQTARHGSPAGLTVITLPEEPSLLGRAVEILAEAEDRIRTLAAGAPDAARSVRVTILVTGADDPLLPPASS